MAELPQAFADRMISMLGEEEYELYKAALQKGLRHALRVNTSRISVEDFISICPTELTPVPWCKNGFYYDEEKFAASKHPFYYAGLYYLQEPSAMLPASVLPVEEDDKVLDICAAPGGKSTELIQHIGKTGYLVSNDISASRAKALLKNLEVFGAENILITCESPDRISSAFPGYFDKILIDAPCSGEGMFRKSSSMISAWSDDRVKEFSDIQRSILKEIVKALKPGGMILYSTCTFNAYEDEQSVEYLLSLDDSLRLADFPSYEGFVPGNNSWGETNVKDIEKTKHLFPHRIEGEGHFVSLIKSEAEADKASGVPSFFPKKVKLTEEITDFLSLIHKKYDPGRFELLGERLFYVPEGCPEASGLRILRRGLLFGEQKKKRFEPSQALAMTLGPGSFKNCLDLPVDDVRVSKYLRGETIDITDEEAAGKSNGYILICVGGYSLGFGKLSQGVIKNKYLPGWRMM